MKPVAASEADCDGDTFSIGRRNSSIDVITKAWNIVSLGQKVSANVRS